MRGSRDTELFVTLRIFCNPKTQFSQHRERAGTQSGDCGCTVVTLLSLHAQSLCRATQSGRDRTQSGFWRWFRATQSGFSVTVRDLALSLHHTVRLCRTQSVDCRATQSDCVGHSRSFPSDCVGTVPLTSRDQACYVASRPAFPHLRTSGIPPRYIDITLSGILKDNR